MFFLHNSNRTEELAEQLGSVVEQAGERSLFVKELFVVQSRGMERMLSQYLADTFGIWGNSSYMLPMQFIDCLCESLHLDYDTSLFERSVLTWRLERLLRDTSAPELQPAVTYLSGEQQELKRFQLARQLADLFDQYQILRPDYIEAWQKGRRITKNRYEPMQQYLWRKLREDVPGALHRGEIILSLIDRLKIQQVAFLDTPRVFVFGLHTLPPLFLAALNGLASHIDVHLFLLSPCALYWGDMETRRARVRRLSGLDAEEQSEYSAEVYHRLLTSLGRQGADFQDLLFEYVDELVEGRESFTITSGSRQMNLLNRLQADILEGRDKPDPETEFDVTDDGSVMVVSCHSKMREVSVLKDHIMNWLYENPELGLHDLVVMAPDIQQYADLIPAVFHDVSYDISDCQKGIKNRYLAIFLQFLELFSGRYTLPDLFSLLERPEIGSRFSISGADLDLVQHWLKEAGVRWGICADQRIEDGLFAAESATWQNGLDRMLMGMATGSELEVADILPFIEIEGSDGELLGNLCSFLNLVKDARSEFRQPKSLIQWSERLIYFSSLLFTEDDLPAFLELQNLLARLAETFAEHHREDVTFTVIRSWLEYETQSKSTAGFLRGRLTFCSMLPMRSIPFKIICLLGINDGEFPHTDQFAPFNLLGEKYRKGDRSKRSDDRYQFLEAILAARKKLYLSYIGQSIRTGDVRPPSPVISELLESLKDGYGVSNLIRHQPLQPYSHKYFKQSSEPGLFSYNEYYFKTAQSLQTPMADVPACWLSSEVETGVKSELNFLDLCRFISAPQTFFVRNVLGINLSYKDDLIDDHEPFVLEGLERYLTINEIVERLRDDQDPDALRDELQKKLHWPLAYPGTKLFQDNHRELSEFVERIAAIEPDNPAEVISFSIDIDSIKLSGILENRYPGGLLFYRCAKLQGKDLLNGWLHHLVAAAVLGKPVETRIVARDKTVVFATGAGDTTDLKMIVELFQSGCRFPSSLFVEPACVYCEQIIKNRGRGRKDPLRAAIEALQYQLDHEYRPELQILYPDQKAVSLLDTAFESLCTEFFMMIRDRAQVVEDGHG